MSPWINPLYKSGSRIQFEGRLESTTFTFHVTPRASGDIYKVSIELASFVRGATEPETVLSIKVLASADPATVLKLHEALAQAMERKLSREWSLNATGLRVTTTNVERIGPVVRMTLNHLPEQEFTAAIRAAADNLDILAQEGVAGLR